MSEGQGNRQLRQSAFDNGRLTPSGAAATVPGLMPDPSEPPLKPAASKGVASAAVSAGGVRISVRGLKKDFHMGSRQLHVLSGIDLDLQSGEVAAVVGASGAGKSTLLHLLGTLDRATGGKIFFDGEDITAKTPAQMADYRNRNIGFVFQFHHLLPEFTAVENVLIPGLIARQPKGLCQARAEELLVRVGLAKRLQHRPGELSGGEQQRVALARALFMRPRLLLADEPTGNLDTRTGEDIHELFFELNQEDGMTILFVTHNDSLAKAAPRCLRMVDGAMQEAV